MELHGEWMRSRWNQVREGMGEMNKGKRKLDGQLSVGGSRIWGMSFQKLEIFCVYIIVF